MGKFNSKVAGVTHKAPDGTDRQAIIAKYCRPGTPLEAIPEPENKFDENAVGLWLTAKGWFSSTRYHVGYISADISDRLSGEIQRGKEVSVIVKDVTGGGSKKFGLNVSINVD
ncbi:HIRAN protein [Alteromonas mediterranea 615]|uniref:HIRAN protein n=1 Tax=Alteromonas mediterranea 615 TaxID=1300253 RepID=S5AME5_9ALTE|nr:HIRAN protein [Alteromonas mediterranea 615]